MGAESRFACVSRCFTTFNGDGDFDEDAFREYLQRFVDASIDPYVASSGTGMGQALSADQLGRVYRAAVEACRDKVQVGANVPEQFTAGRMLDQIELAVDSGVDIVNIYGPDGRHSYRPTDSEYLRFFDAILAQVKHAVALCPLPSLGYRPRADTIARVCNTYPQVSTVLLTGIFDDVYFIDLLGYLDREVRILCVEQGSANTLRMGAAGISGNLAGVIPQTYRRYLDLVAENRLEDAAQPYTDIRRLQALFASARWAGGRVRLHQMYLDEFGQPGANGRLPSPYLNPTIEEAAEFRAQILALDIAELRVQLRSVGSQLL